MTLTDPTTPGGSSSPGAFTDAVLIGDIAGGVAWIPASTPLTRLNYYDGRLLRADDLNVEQRAQRAYAELSNRAGGPGVVHGFDVRHQTGSLVLSPGLAIDPQGRVLFLPGEVRTTVAKLVEAASKTDDRKADAPSAGGSGFEPCEVATATPNVPTVGGMQLYVVALAHTEGLCGTVEVFGRLCDDACITATDRPYRLDGVVLLLRPLSLVTPLLTSTAVTLDSHLRSRVAAAAFADERTAAGSRLSAATLATNVWCRGAPALIGDVVPLAVLAWDGTAIGFLDVWTARRERMEPPPRAYWAVRMELRPWPVFLAQMLQFQCQLADVLTGPAPGGSASDACSDAAELLGESTLLLDGLAEEVAKLGGGADVTPDLKGQTPLFSKAQVERFRAKVARLLSGRDWVKPPAGPAAGMPAHLLIDGGIVEAPAAGYLPVDPGSTKSIRAQVQDLLGGGVDLRLCAVRRDQIPHELERAQHMDRISLLRGLDDPTAKEKVDVLVPDGRTVPVRAADPGRSFAVEGAIGFQSATPPARRERAESATDTTLDEFRDAAIRDPRLLPMRGAGRLDIDTTGVNVRVAVVGDAGDAARSLLRLFGVPAGEGLNDLVARAKRLKVTASPVTREVLDEVGRAVAEEVLRHRAGATGTTARARVVSLAAQASAKGVVALWATGWAATDPFTLPVGGSAAFSATLDLYAPWIGSLASLRIDGQATVLSSVKSGALRHVTLRVAVSRDGRMENLRDVPAPAGSGRGDVVLTRGVVDGEQMLGFRTPGARYVSGVGSWSGDPIVAQAAVGRVRRGEGDDYGISIPGERLLEVRAVEDPDIAEPDNAYHGFAEHALTTLQGAEPDDPAFLDTAYAQLFPPRAAKDSVEVRATTDWVLFRRRRREECESAGTPTPTPSAVAAFVARADGADDAKDIAWRLRDPDQSVRDVSWEPFGTADFERGTAVLRTAGGVLRDGYRTAGGGGIVVFAGYSPPGFSDPVGRPRAQAVAMALTPEAVLVDPGSVDLVINPPRGPVPGTEASVFLVSYEQPESGDCVNVVALNDGTDLGAPLRRELIEGDVDALVAGERIWVPLADVPWIDGQLDEERRVAMLKALEEHLRGQAEFRLRAVDLVAWIAADWAKRHEDEARDHLQVLADQLSLGLETVKVVDYRHENQCPVLLVVMVRSE